VSTNLVVGALGIEHGEQHFSVTVALGLVCIENIAQGWRGRLQEESTTRGKQERRGRYLFESMPCRGQNMSGGMWLWMRVVDRVGHG